LTEAEPGHRPVASPLAGSITKKVGQTLTVYFSRKAAFSGLSVSSSTSTTRSASGASEGSLSNVVLHRQAKVCGTTAPRIDQHALPSALALAMPSSKKFSSGRSGGGRRAAAGGARGRRGRGGGARAGWQAAGRGNARSGDE
jgi:hypothetical protein